MKLCTAFFSTLTAALAAGSIAAQPQSPPAAALFDVNVRPGDSIKIGAIFALTGAASNLGVPQRKSAELLVEEINARGGIKGHKFVLLIRDSGSDPQKALFCAKHLIEKDRVLAIIGPSTCGESLAMKNLCTMTKTILISCAAGDAIVNPPAPFVFQTPPKISDAAVMILAELKKMKLDTVAVTSSTSDFGKEGRSWFEGMARKAGFKILLSEEYDKEAIDLKDILNKVKAAGVQVVVNWSSEPVQAVFASGIKSLALTIPVFLSYGFGDIGMIKQAGESAENVIFPGGRLLVADALPGNGPQNAAILKYRNHYRTRYGEEAGAFGGYAYDAVMLLQKAMEAAPGVKKTQVREALEKIRGSAGVTGTFNMSAADHNGLDMNAFIMLTVKGNTVTQYGK
jgi:branched-chain amino acid transport system substrate-binding protein